MKEIKYEELREIRRGFGVLFILVLTYLGDLLKGYVKTPKPSEKETFLILATGFILFITTLGIVIVSFIIWKKTFNKGDRENG